VIFAWGSAASTRRGRAAAATDATAIDSKNDLRFMAHLLETLLNPNCRAASRYSPVGVQPNMAGSSVFSTIGTPASYSRRRGCSARLFTTPVNAEADACGQGCHSAPFLRRFCRKDVRNCYFRPIVGTLSKPSTLIPGRNQSAVSAAVARTNRGWYVPR